MSEVQGVERDDFYVGYLPVPRRHRTAALVIAMCAMVLMVSGAAFIARMQKDPGDAVWAEGIEEFTGTMLSEPAPMLVVEGPRVEDVILLVEEGKHGAQERATAWDGKRVAVRGRTLTREGFTLVEIAAGDGSVRGAEGEPALVARREEGAITLRGEIIDSKCYHGAMKPGEGKAHKACATLCIRNGIPPMVAAPSANGMDLHLLVMEGGGALDEDTLSKIGEEVEVTGAAASVAGMSVVTIAAGSVKRVE